MDFWSLCPSFPLDFLPGLTGEGEEGIWWHREWRCSYQGSFLPQIIMFMFNQIRKESLKWFLIPRRENKLIWNKLSNSKEEIRSSDRTWVPPIITVEEIPEWKAQGAPREHPLMSQGSWASTAGGSFIDLSGTSRMVGYRLPQIPCEKPITQR